MFKRGKAADSMLYIMPLCQAAVEGDLVAMKDLLAKGADINVWTPYDHRTPLHFAAAGGHLEMVQYLIEDAEAEMYRDRHNGFPFHDAKQNGHAEIVTYLQKVDVNVESLCELNDSSPLDLSHLDKQKDDVFFLMVREGIFSYQVVQKEVRHFYENLGLHPAYFDRFSVAEIARHVQCVIAAKSAARTRGERQIKFHIEDEKSGFYLATAAPSPAMRLVTEDCNKYLLETVARGEAYSLMFMASDGPVFALGKEDERIGIFIVYRSPWGPSVAEKSIDDLSLTGDKKDFSKIATTQFLARESSEGLALHQKLVAESVRTRSMVSYVCPGTAFQSSTSYARGHVVFFATHESGGPTARPLFTDIQELLWHTNLRPRRYYIEVFANGCATYALYFPNEAQANGLQAAMRYIQLTKRVPGRSGLIWKEVIDGHITPEHSVFVGAIVKFCFAFFPKEKYVPQYAELLKMLYTSSSKQKLDELYLQTVREIITEPRIYEIASNHSNYMRQFYEDFKNIATGEAKPFWNKDLDKQIEEHVRDRDPLAAQVLRMFLLFNHCLRITNFFRADQPPSALAFRLDPTVLLAGRPKSLYPEVPYGIFLVVGRTFHGFHVRFREISRGGLRAVRSASRPVYNKNDASLFGECYNLAYTQQLKNKDIPEGGSKGVILLDTVAASGANAQSNAACRDCFMQYVDSLLDCMILPAGLVSHLPDKEFLFFGPDEGTADFMDMGALRARDRGYQYWKAITTGKSVQLGGVPHDVYGITTRGVREYVRETLRMLNIEEKNITKVQTGGPDGDLGSNEILQSFDRTVALVDVSGVAYDPAGLNRTELTRLAKGRLQIKEFDRSLIGAGGFMALCGDQNVVTPDGTQYRTGVDLRDKFMFTAYARADLFVPCGGRPATVNASNVQQLFIGGKPPFSMIVEGANLFFTNEARVVLEDAGVHLFKDSSANKGGVTSSSLEVLVSLAMEPSDHDKLMSAPEGAELPEFYKKYVELIIARIEENCKGEFKSIWEANTAKPKPGTNACEAMSKLEASRRLSMEITRLQDHIAIADLPDALVRKVLPLAVPKILVEHCGVDGIIERVPKAYVKATIAFWLASKYVYENGIIGSNSFAFHMFMRRFTPEVGAAIEKIVETAEEAVQRDSGSGLANAERPAPLNTSAVARMQGVSMQVQPAA